MDTWVLWFLLLQSVLQYPQPMGDGLDEVTRLRMEARAKFQEEEKIRLEWEMEQLVLKQGVWAWEDLLWSASQHWQAWALAGLLLFVLAVWYIWRKRSLRREEHEGADEEEGRNVDANEEDGGNEGEEEENGVNGEANNNDDNHDRDNAIARMDMERIQWPVQDLEEGCNWVTALMNNFAFHFRRVLANSFYPVLKPAIGVGSAFEGWSPCEQDVVYQVLIAMTPPRGHSFHLELDAEGPRHERDFCIRVQQERTCLREQWDKNLLCFLHHPEEELRSNQEPSLLHGLCTDSYLDVYKTARWFYMLVRAVWPSLPQARNWHLTVLSFTRSCQFKVSNGRKSYQIEMLFGVQMDNSDIFVSSEPRDYSIRSTIWPETYAVAEVKFFNYIARRAPPDSLHLKCLQFFICLPLTFHFSTYIAKTIVMHLLNTLPPSWWCRRHYARRLLDISKCLCTCVEGRRLNHFIVGNWRLPQGISLPPQVLTAEQLNLFHDLVMDPHAHSEAVCQYMDLHRWLIRITNNEQ